MKRCYGIIYKATNTVNGKVYIGQTIKTLEKRKLEHIKLSESKSDLYFHRAIRKYKKSNFIWDEIDTANNRKELNLKEIRWIREYKSCNSIYGYNMTIGGQIGGCYTQVVKDKISKTLTGRKLPEETKRKIALSSKGRKWSKESIQKRLNTMKNYRHSEKTKEKIRLSRIGKKLSVETKKKIGEKSKGRTHKYNISESEKLRISTMNIGKHLSKETIEKIRIGNLGKVISKESRLKMSKARIGKPSPNKGKPASEVQKRKQSESMKKIWAEKKLNEIKRVSGL